MFIGHYAPAAFAAGTNRIKLWQAFVGAQLVDYAWAVLVMAGVEKARITPGFTQASPLDLYHMPYTHSLGMAVIWAVGSAVLFALIFRKQAKVGALIFGLVVLSHWVTDLIVHIPDLPLWFGTQKYGLGLWNHRAISITLEIGLVLVGMAYYLKQTRAKGKAGIIWPLVLVFVMVVLQVYGNYGPPPKSIMELTISAWIAYTVFAGLAYAVDRSRISKTALPS